MQVSRITVEVLEIPVGYEYIAGGNVVSSNWHVLVRLYTDDGVEGIGYIVALRSGLVRAVAQAAEELGQALIGQSVMEVEKTRARMEAVGAWAGPGGVLSMAMAPLDIALWDAKGKILGLPLYQLLGGSRDRVRTYASDGLWYSLSIEDLVQSAEHHVAQGHDKLKLRLGHEATPEGEVARVRAVQEAVGPEVQIMVDIAETWTEAQAVPGGRALQEAGIVWLEDPMSHQNVAGLAHLAQVLDVPVAGGEHLYTLDAFQKTFAVRALDMAIIDLARIGGITPWMKVAALTEALNIPVSGHVIPEVHIHLLAAAPNGHLIEYMPRSEPIFKTRLKFEEGHLVAPVAPGLGVELDEAACRQYRVQ
ncbi:MAG: mandelate racemase/muconate lactonizing enzyme family protein [Dehalococcoidia bacterium]